MTALQDWLSLRPVDQATVLSKAVFRHLLAVLSTPDGHDEFKVMGQGLERC